MPKFFIEKNQINNNRVILVNEDVKHIANVLRKNIGDEINICNINTSENFLCQISKIYSDKIECDIIKKLQAEAEPNTEITIFQGIPKAEKMEFIIQKCTEIGAKYFIPVQMDRCIVKMDNKTQIKKIERWQKIAETAAKQSGRDIIPKVENPINFQNLLYLIKKYDIVLLAYENEDNNTLKNEILKIKDKKDLKIGIIIGPEGGITENEVKSICTAGAKSVSLGKRILRTETAGMYMTSIVIYELE